MTPMVAAVPKAVPVRRDMPQLSRKASSRKSGGQISSDAQQTMTAMVPQARHRAVKKPMRPKVMRTFFTVFTPVRHIVRISRQARPCFRA